MSFPKRNPRVEYLKACRAAMTRETLSTFDPRSIARDLLISEIDNKHGSDYMKAIEADRERLRAMVSAKADHGPPKAQQRVIFLIWDAVPIGHAARDYWRHRTPINYFAHAEQEASHV